MTYIHNEIPIIQKTYDLYKTNYEYTKAFPKSDKYALGEKTKLLILDMLELLIEAEAAKREWKEPVLEKVSNKLGVLKMIFRLAHEIKILDGKKYLQVTEQSLEIGRMLGGWLKSVK
jgi:hypothetical protein